MQHAVRKSVPARFESGGEPIVPPQRIRRPHDSVRIFMFDAGIIRLARVQLEQAFTGLERADVDAPDAAFVDGCVEDFARDRREARGPARRGLRRGSAAPVDATRSWRPRARAASEHGTEESPDVQLFHFPERFDDGVDDRARRPWPRPGLRRARRTQHLSFVRAKVTRSSLPSSYLKAIDQLGLVEPGLGGGVDEAGGAGPGRG